MRCTSIVDVWMNFFLMSVLMIASVMLSCWVRALMAEGGLFCLACRYRWLRRSACFGAFMSNSSSMVRKVFWSLSKVCSMVTALRVLGLASCSMVVLIVISPAASSVSSCSEIEELFICFWRMPTETSPCLCWRY